MSRDGVTLIELLVVLAFLALAAAVTLPALRPPAAEGAGPSAAALERAWLRARAEASRRGRPVTVVLETATGAWAVLAPRDGMAPDTLDAGFLPLGDARIAGGTDAFARATWDALGRARADAVRLSAPDASRTLSADPWTGAVRRDER